MRRLVLSIVMAVTVACASRPEPAPPPAGPIDPRPFLVRVADSTITLVGFAAIQSDTANVQARVALRESSPERVRYRVENARNAAAVAARFVEAAIAQGDYLREVLPITPGAKEESANYTKYWRRATPSESCGSRTSTWRWRSTTFGPPTLVRQILRESGDRGRPRPTAGPDGPPGARVRAGPLAVGFGARFSRGAHAAYP
jgi:hypothetical protein